MNWKLKTERRNLRKGFTLVELLVVIAIIGVLATLVLLQLGAARARSRDAKRIADVNQLRSAIELFYEDNNGNYPDNLVALDASPYITRVPKDPLSNLDYGYCVSTGKHSYHLYAKLEQKATGALNADSDINSTAGVFSGCTGAGIDGSGPVGSGNETCETGDGSDCIYDVGVESFD